MAYCTKADLVALIGAEAVDQLSTVGGVQSDAYVTAAIDEADRVIDSYAHKRHAVPFAVTPPTIKTLSLQMSIRNLRRNRNMTIAQDVENEKTDRKWLEALSKGEVSIAVEPAPEASELAVDKYEERDETQKNVSRERLKGFW